MLQYLSLLLAIPLGIALAKTTKDEKPIYTKYFPAILWLIIITSAIFFTTNKQLALTTTFTFITTLTWYKS